MTATVLITGGLGYLGGRTALALAHAGGYRLLLGTRRRKTDSPAGLPQAETVVMELTEAAALDPICSGVDIIVHLAAVNEIESAADPALALAVNTQGTLRLLQAACRQKVRRFIYFSTAHVYGAPLAGRIDETTLPRPQHPYAITHRAAEDFVLAARRDGKIEGLVLRLSNGYGAPADPAVNRWTLLVNDLCRQAVVERQITLNTPGLQMRDFVTLTDAGRATLHLAALPQAAAGDGLYNLGGENPMRVCDMAETIAGRCLSTLGYRPPVRKPAPTGSEPVRTLDYRIDKLKATGFSLAGDINAEIDDTLRLCQSAFGASSPARATR